MKQKIFLFLLAFNLLPGTYAYDVIGHRTVANIAYDQLNLSAKQQIDDLLGVRGLIYLSTWADDVRNDSAYAYSYDWHFQDLPDSLSAQELQYLWNNPLSQGEHLFYAMQTMMKRLKTNKNDAEALKFLVHFLADFHQPFHLGREEDRGGNDIQTKWFGENIRVHQLWDRFLVEHQGYSYTEYSRYLQDKYFCEKNYFQNQTTFQSLQAVYALRQELYTYNYSKMQHYAYNFMYKNKLDEMLYRAGTQLAKILNGIYAVKK